MKIKINKKGELTSKQLITIIILIASFSVILMFFFLFDFPSVINEESCRNSVMMRGSLSVVGKSPVELKCKTKDICLSYGGDCGGKGEKIVVRSELGLSNEMIELMKGCWWMMGEGKVKYSKDGCAICYRVNFDDDITEKIKYSSIYEKMAEKKLPKSEESYLYNMFKMTSVFTVRNKIIQDTGIDINSGEIDTSKEYVVVTSVNGNGFVQPIFIEFKASELKDKLKCGEYVTEV